MKKKKEKDKLAVGDRVMLVCKMVPGTRQPVPKGMIGYVQKVDRNGGAYIEYVDDNGVQLYWFNDWDFRPVRNLTLPPDFTLEEIEQAEKIIARMG